MFYGLFWHGSMFSVICGSFILRRPEGRHLFIIDLNFLFFCRHGVARHNVIDPRTGRQPDKCDTFFFDPPLVLDGKMAAVKAGEDIQTWWKTTQGGEAIDLIITSPLTRCIQTALFAFMPGDNYEQCISRKLFCIESVREAYGMHYPDKRRKRSILQVRVRAEIHDAHRCNFCSTVGNSKQNVFIFSQKTWPAVTFDPEMQELDILWKPDERETVWNVEQRIAEFFSWIIQREEENIVVVSHGVWIEVCLKTLCPNILQVGRRVYNCDAYSGQIVSRDGKFLRLDHVQQISGPYIK